MDDTVLTLIGLVHVFITHGPLMYAQTASEKKRLFCAFSVTLLQMVGIGKKKNQKFVFYKTKFYSSSTRMERFVVLL